MTHILRPAFGLFSTVLLVAVACGDDEEGGTGGAGGAPAGGDGGDLITGASCEVAADCYPGIPPEEIEGDILCLDRVEGGYCTHTCETDADCCSAESECEAGILEVCSPFESADDKMCFLSCEEEDLVPAPGQSGPVDEQEYCQREAGPDFICRSSGGGSENRKICVPGDCGVGADCADAAGCEGDLECVLAFDGGYCSVSACTEDADCPTDTRCVDHVDGQSYCLTSCDSEWDCTFCRLLLHHASCSSEVTFAQAPETGSVCVPD